MSSRLFLRVAVAAGLLLAVQPESASAQSAYVIEMNSGREAFDGSNFQLAERHFQGAYDAAGSDGQKATAMYSLAVIAAKLGRPDEAKERAGKAIELSPKNSQAKRLLEELASAPPPKAVKTAKAPSAAADTAAPAAENGERAPAKKAQATKARDAAQDGGAAAPEPRRTVVREISPAAPEKPATSSPATKPAAEPKAEPREAVQVQAQAQPQAREPAPSRPAVAARPPAAAAAAEAPKAPAQASAPATAPPVAKIIASLPSQPAGLLAAGFAATDAQAVLVVGPHAAAEADRQIELKRFELTPGTAGDTYALHSEIAAGIVAMPPQGTLLATAIAGDQPKKQAAGGKQMVALVHIWDVASVDNKHAIEMTIPDRGSAATGIEMMEMSRNGRRLVVAHRTGIEILDTSGLRGVAAYRFGARQQVAGGDAPASMAVSANGSRVVLTNGTKLRIADGKSVKDFGPAGNTAVFEHIALSDDGKLIAASSGPSVRFFDAVTGKESEPLPDAAAAVTALAFSPAGDRLAVATEQTVRVWSLSARTAELELDAAGSVQRMAFSSDNKELLAAGQKGSRIWGIESGPLVTSAIVPPRKTVMEKPAAEAPKPAGAPVAAEAAAEPAAKTPPAGPAVEMVKPAAPPPAAVANMEKAEKAEPAAPPRDLRAERVAALAAADCAKVKALDAEIGDAGQHAVCAARVARAEREAEVAAREAERKELLGRYEAAIKARDCAAARAADEKLGRGDSKALAACELAAVREKGTAREIYLAAAKLESDADRSSAKALYRTLVDRFPQDDLALKAAERMQRLSELDAAEAQSKAKSGDRAARR